MFYTIISFIEAQHGTVVTMPWEDSTYVVMPSGLGLVPPQYSAPPPPSHHHHHYNQHHNHNSYTNITCTPNTNFGSGSINSSAQNIVAAIVSGGDSSGAHHKSMWAVNPLCASNTGKELCKNELSTSSYNNSICLLLRYLF